VPASCKIALARRAAMNDLATVLALYRRAYQALNQGQEPHIYADTRGIYINHAGPYRPRSVEAFARDMLKRATPPGGAEATP
jgi:hypothetical protein